jgi:hypothetical protein
MPHPLFPPLPTHLCLQLLFTRFDAPALERVVGTERAGRLLEDGPKASFVFV